MHIEIPLLRRFAGGAIIPHIYEILPKITFFKFKNEGYHLKLNNEIKIENQIVLKNFNQSLNGISRTK